MFPRVVVLLCFLAGSLPGFAEGDWAVSLLSKSTQLTEKPPLYLRGLGVEFLHANIEISAEYLYARAHSETAYRKLELTAAYQWDLENGRLFHIEHETKYDLLKGEVVSDLKLNYEQTLKYGYSYSLELDSEIFQGSSWSWQDSEFSPALEYRTQSAIGNFVFELSLPINIFGSSSERAVELHSVEYKTKYSFPLTDNSFLKAKYEFTDYWQNNKEKEELEISIEVLF